jgi:hypothetical protein
MGLPVDFCRDRVKFQLPRVQHDHIGSVRKSQINGLFAGKSRGLQVWRQLQGVVLRDCYIGKALGVDRG